MGWLPSRRPEMEVSALHVLEAYVEVGADVETARSTDHRGFILFRHLFLEAEVAAGATLPPRSQRDFPIFHRGYQTEVKFTTHYAAAAAPITPPTDHLVLPLGVNQSEVEGGVVAAPPPAAAADYSIVSVFRRGSYLIDIERGFRQQITATTLIRVLWRVPRQVLRRQVRALHRWTSGRLRFLRRLVTWLRPLPRKHSWRGIMGNPMAQHACSSCVLVACTVCIEALHRLEFEAIYGAGTFPFRAACPRKLRNACGRTKYRSSVAEASEVIWSRRSGARFEPVLRLIAARGGIPTTDAPPQRHLMLPISGFRHYELYDHSTSTWRLTREQVARLIYAHGPCPVGLFVTSDYYSGWWSGSGGDDDDDDSDPVLYRGFSNDPAQRRERQRVDPYAGNHAAVCYVYEFVGEELHLRLLDSQESLGPRLWVEYEAIDRIATLSVDPVDPSNWAY